MRPATQWAQGAAGLFQTQAQQIERHRARPNASAAGLRMTLSPSQQFTTTGRVGAEPRLGITRRPFRPPASWPSMRGTLRSPTSMSDGAAAFALDRAVLAAAWEGVATDVLEEVGLEGALRSLAQQAASRGSLKLTLDLGYAQRHSQEQLLFSAARELLANVIEHAEATQRVRIEAAGGSMNLASSPGRGTRVEIRVSNKH